MKRLLNNLLLWSGCLGAAMGAQAQTGHLTDVQVTETRVERTGPNVDFRMTFDLSQVEVKRQQSIQLVPVLVSDDETRSQVLRPIVIDGSVRYRVHRRQHRLNYSTPFDRTSQVLGPNDDRSRPVVYTDQVPYEPWMLQARLVLRETLTGCRDCRDGQAESTLLAPALEPYRPQYVWPFLTPSKEEVKRRDEVRIIRLQFRQDSHQLLKDFGNNARELAVARKAVETVKADPYLTFTQIQLTGYASPEGGQTYNQRLSEHRAQALVKDLQRSTHTDASLWKVNGAGEDWYGLRQAIEAAEDLPQKAELLQAMDRCSSVAERDQVEPKLRARLGLPAWETLYAPLRRNECRLAYTVKNFTTEEARELIKTRPELLSAEEMYAVAATYETGSAEYEEVLQTAARFYPRQVAPVVNAAHCKLLQGDVKGTITMLEKADAVVRSDAAALNALGVAYALSRQFERASELLRQAEAAGSAEATQNRQQLQRVLEDLYGTAVGE